MFTLQKEVKPVSDVAEMELSFHVSSVESAIMEISVLNSN